VAIFECALNYRGLNNLTIKNGHPPRALKNFLIGFQGAKVFSRLYLPAGYNQIRIREQDIPKRAFATRYGHFEYRVMPFGMCNAPATFLTLMRSLFKGVEDCFVITYLDDILVFSKTEEEHINHLRSVFTILKEPKLVAKPSKCQFFETSISFLRYTISEQGISVDSQKTNAISSI
jgi:hypothetical protein